MLRGVLYIHIIWTVTDTLNVFFYIALFLKTSTKTSHGY